MTAAFVPARQPDDPALLACGDAALRSLTAVLNVGGAEPDGPLAAARALVEAADPAALRAAVLHPLFRHWRSTLDARVKIGAGDRISAWLDSLPRLLLAPALLARDDFARVRVPLVRGDQLRVPGLPRHLVVRPGTDPSVVVSREGGELRVERDGVTETFPAGILAAAGLGESRRPVLAGTPVELDATDPWVEEVLAGVNATPSPPPYPPRDIRPVPDATRVEAVFSRAAGLIGRAWPDCLAELTTHVRLVVPFTSALMEGWTSLSHLGAIFLRAVSDDDVPDPVRFTAERLVHEAAHTRLYVLSVRTRFFAEGGQHRLLSSPLRKDARPAAGVYHAAFVLARVAVVMARAAAVTGDERFAERGHECHAEFREAQDTLATSGALSEAGTELLEEAAAHAASPASGRVSGARAEGEGT
ncbi:aKG-HExxH-type peptide beta-hydroxylase [Amycolatopsis sp. NBC_01286]|uniref:aKG-HExxH-type peptide beta-hydroxylase n=1 Tax=Amycolatopsis sp. NBC_01286 TaxID=2903560 RepID=UPI002E136C7B|nr:HEXXH motif-containing putative peptide modification protein [Amycolatopsis sp. NBC_01286]